MLDERETPQSILDDMTKLRQDIQDLEQWVKDAKEQLNGMVATAIHACTNIREIRQTSRILYWEFGQCSRTAMALNLHAYQMPEYVGSWTVDRICTRCNTHIIASYQSMNAWKHRAEEDKYICPVCEIEIKEERQMYWQEIQQRRNEQAARYVAYVQQLKAMPYKDYLYTEHWQDTRQKALTRAGFRCQTCNQENHLQVHHRTYERRGQELPEDLIVLCAPCHKTFHENRKVKS